MSSRGWRILGVDVADAFVMVVDASRNRAFAVVEHVRHCDGEFKFVQIAVDLRAIAGRDSSGAQEASVAIRGDAVDGNCDELIYDKCGLGRRGGPSDGWRGDPARLRLAAFAEVHTWPQPETRAMSRAREISMEDRLRPVSMSRLVSRLGRGR